MVTLAAASVNKKSGFINIRWTLIYLGVMGSGEGWVNHEFKFSKNYKISIGLNADISKTASFLESKTIDTHKNKGINSI